MDLIGIIATSDQGPIEKAGQLAAALDLSTEELASYDDLATVLECRFGRVEPAVGLRQRLGTRYRKPWENGRAGGRREVPGTEGVSRLPAHGPRGPG
ncbi:UNVERIFIED_CONTAM: hypothetical protein FKN15_074968 [Acipenser sinensis]